MKKRALTIAGSDSGGGAGIQADLKTFSAFGVYGMSAVTALTAQNTLTVAAVRPAGPDFVRLQVSTVLSDLGADGVKTGMLVDAETAAAVASVLSAARVPLLVVDPVMTAKDGSTLLLPDAVEALKRGLFPLADLVTPNLAEAEALTGCPVRDEKGMAEAARAVQAMGARAVLVKGGHLDGDPVDILFDGARIHRFPGPRSGSRPAHGTGCTLSAAILCLLLLGRSLTEAVAGAKAYVGAALRGALPFGSGSAVLDHGVPPGA